MSIRSNSPQLLAVKNLGVAYSSIQVVWDLNLEVRAGEVVSIIGANGAGKTTTLRAVAGLISSRAGSVTFDSAEVTREPAHRRVRRHLALIPEGRQLWGRMTVEENLVMGAFPSHLRPRARQNLDRVYSLFPRLEERRLQLAGTLSGGEQQMCAVGRGLMAEPKLLMLDEPSLGLAPIMVDQVFTLIRRIADEGVTILLAAQNANYALKISHYTYVMEWGRLLLEGTSEDLRSSDHVRRAYLGA
jgi:branched-chain amino acid transport system ATP-binding protein